MRGLRSLVTVCGLALTAGCGSADVVVPGVDEAHTFIAAAEKRLDRLGRNAARAAWVQNTFITVDTQRMAAAAQSEFAAAVSAGQIWRMTARSPVLWAKAPASATNSAVVSTPP